MVGVARVIRVHGWWIACSLVVALVLGIVIGLVAAWVLYAAVNGTGTVLYVDGLSLRSARARRKAQIMTVASAVLLPVGVFGLLASPAGTEPTDGIVGDPKHRNDASMSAIWGQRGGGGPGI